MVIGSIGCSVINGIRVIFEKKITLLLFKNLVTLYLILN